MSDTPRTDAFKGTEWNGLNSIDFARQLERELNEAKKEVAAANNGAKTNSHVNQALAKRIVECLEQRDEWRKCAEELADWLNLLHAKEQTPCNDKCEVGNSIARLKNLKGKTK